MKKAALFSVFALLVLRNSWSFDWSMGLSSSSRETDDKPLSRPFTLRDGDSFALRIKGEAPAYCYIIAVDSENAVAVLNSQALQKDEEITIGPLVLILPGGRETFYVIMSDIAQRGLEARIRALGESQNSRQAEEALLNEIFGIRNTVSRLRERPEIPVPMGGAFRGDELSFTSASKYSGADCYVKTIVIRH
ncbi:MAG: DUF4384 domain-containing protein [Treponema sp.]|jgi:hypothetical protein|nr:DUF4384 domain-containing protein [Treponema sp.]